MGCGKHSRHEQDGLVHNGTKSPTKNTKTASPYLRSTLPSSPYRFERIADKFQTLQEVQDGLRQCGLESSNLIIAIDYTKSNTWNGKKSFGGKCLHAIATTQQPYGEGGGGKILNPYQEVITIVGQTLSVFDDDNLIPSYGFGDITTKDKTVFPFYVDTRKCYGFEEVLRRYEEITPNVVLSGPTSFAPIIYEAINIVKQGGGYNILVIIADGQVDNTRETTRAIVDASSYALSIIVIGVGDGPWDTMRHYDDDLPERKFDNFQFVPYNDTIERAENKEVAFSIAALQEIPEQYHAIKTLGYL